MTFLQHNDGNLTVIHRRCLWLLQTETWIYTQVRYLPEDVTSHIVCEALKNLDQYALPNIHCRSDASVWQYLFGGGVSRQWFRPSGAYLSWVARRERADVLHSHFGFQGWADMDVAKEVGLKHVVTFYGLDASRLPKQYPVWARRYRRMFAWVDCVLCEGPHMAQSVLELGCPPERLRVHHLGVRTDEIVFEPRVWTRAEPLRVLIAGAFREKKGIPYALEALGLLQHHIPLEITIIGDASPDAASQAEKQKIMTSIEKNRLTQKVRLLGYQPHAVLFSQAYKHHVFLSPSVTASDGDTEGGAPVSIIEMAASGMPVVSTKHCDIPGVIEDGVSGLLAEERDVEGLVAHLGWLADHPTRWQEMVHAARKHVEARFDARLQGQKLAAIYKDVVQS